ncbi:hypothetical protein [Xanthomonas vesicatoria]|nr:hypothetical protein [Xanthomonas vesicatoria]MCC8559107.1 hypothetical protein [Xanthomonas vesicatoria]MCC8602066.1 hypothetical protein [Xanthomonas vesicatoria]MCC8610492.1 hypothetical protein [Xanthomonas vesicatoria]MCC8674663.1 hypothetical protein [Xanthomonas vesicatoria]MCC8678711.1 hypothetical protein [Xanthomonas vesicatoria]
MKRIAAILGVLCCANVFAQDLPADNVRIDLSDVMSGTKERSLIAGACSRLSAAALRAHAQGKLSTSINEAAKFRELGFSSDPFFNELVRDFRLQPKGDFLFAALFMSQVTIAWLEERAPYSRDVDSLYMAYLAASCAQVTKIEGV